MPIEILMPALSPTMEEGTLAKWLVKEGDTVASGDLLAEIETDKATMEFEAVDEGIIGKLLVAEGTENVAVNSAIAVLLEDGEAASEVAAAPSASASPAPAPESAISSPAKPATLASSPASAPRAAPEKAAEGARVFATPLARKLAAQNDVDLTKLSGSGPRGRIVKA
ncbi:MAG: biotin/lipoyl-containing protein, partial [Paracoccaceae bacterium]